MRPSGERAYGPDRRVRTREFRSSFNGRSRAG